MLRQIIWFMIYNPEGYVPKTCTVISNFQDEFIFYDVKGPRKGLLYSFIAYYMSFGCFERSVCWIHVPFVSTPQSILD